MRKRLITPTPARRSVARDRLSVENSAAVEVTSEDGAYPVEGALLPAQKRGWRAAGPLTPSG